MSKKFYPTPSDVKCYINGVELDDLYRVDFKRQINRQPIYGYNDVKFGFVAEGKELVSGQLILNFRYPGYLYNAILNSTVQQAISIDAQRTALGKKLDESLDQLDLKAMEGMSLIDKATFISNQLKQENPSNYEIAETMKRNYRDRFLPDNDTERSSPMSSTLDLLQKFDLTIKYGQHDASAGFVRVFKDCYLLGESSTFSAAAGGNDMSNSAQPIFEIYPFFAKTIKVVTSADSSAHTRAVQKAVQEATLRGTMA
jgi:hypothetical protein